jgi:hypothetical protein
VFYIEVPASTENGVFQPIRRLLALIRPVKVTRIQKTIGHQVVTEKGSFLPDVVVEADEILGLTARVIRVDSREEVFINRPGSYSYLGLEFDEDDVQHD